MFIHLALAFVMPLFAEWQYGDEGFQIGIEFAVGYVLFISSILFIVHRQYWLVNRSQKLVYCSTNKSFKLIGPNVDIEFSPKDVAQRTVNISRAVAGKGGWYFPWDGYIFESIELTNGANFTVTSLLLPELNWPCELPNTDVKIDSLRWPKNA